MLLIPVFIYIAAIQAQTPKLKKNQAFEVSPDQNAIFSLKKPVEKDWAPVIRNFSQI